MLFNSLQFLIFFPIVLLVYFILPNKVKHLWLLISSYYFYMCWNATYALLILTSTVLTYLSGLLIEHIKNSDLTTDEKVLKKKWIVAFSFISNLAILFFFKYYNFTIGLLSSAFSVMHVKLNIPTFDVLLPVGISFYTFQALSYTMDVYRDDIPAEKNFFRYALFVSFFPQLVAGPIERSKNLLSQLREPKKFDFENAKEGLLLMLWGFFLKIVVAERIALFVDMIYDNNESYGGLYLVIATVLFAFQIYCDFSGYSTIAMGTAKFFNIELMDNFNAPYFSTSVASFWRNWHISLTSWFKDYLYFPLGGSKKGTTRKYINKFIVFFVSGLWHGAQLTYVFWGSLNGLYQIIGEILLPIRRKLMDIAHIDKDKLGTKLIQSLFTFVLIDFAFVFFRAESLKSALKIIKSILTVWNPWIIFDGSLFSCGLDEKNFRFTLFALLILLFADFCKFKNIKIREFVLKQDFWFRCLFFSFSILFILVFGKYGPAYDSTNFIYFQF